MTRVLVVDDEPNLLRAMVLNLANRGYEVSTAETVSTALEKVTTFEPNLLVLDLGLPDGDGLDVIRELQRQEPGLPIVVLSARSGSQDKVVALDLGAVDYVTKPFDMNELVARLRAVLRRASYADPEDQVTFGEVTVDFDARVVHRSGKVVHLTPTEWRIIEVLLARPGKLVTSTDLLTAVRGAAEHTEGSYLRIYFAQLRRKLEVEPSRPRHLLTELGMGYRFQP
jgi:two-component system, OmpR family, KDP operon response regulator KdpE